MITRKVCPRYTLWLTAAIGLTASSSCSLLYDLNTRQCDITDDCKAQGSQFKYSVCQNHVCVAVAASAGGANSNGGQGGIVATGGGQPQGGSGGTTGGTATVVSGTGGQVNCGTDIDCCITNAECITNHNDQPYICKSNRCLLLTDNTYCPILIPPLTYLSILKNPDYTPIIVGGFANMTSPQSLYETKSVINWAMAMDEFNNSSTLKGLPGFNGGNRRPFIGLMCNWGDSTHITSSMKRLTEDIGVSAILTTLSPDNLITAYNYTNTTTVSPLTNPNYAGRPVIYMNAVAANLEIARENTQNLVWNMLGDPNVLAATTAALLKQIEPYVNKQRAAAGDIPDPNTNPLKVTLVMSDDQSVNEIGKTLTAVTTTHPESKLWFNNRYAIDDTTGSFRQSTEPTSPYSGPSVNVSATLAELQNHPPHVIVVMATNEFAKQVIGTVEASWSGLWGITQIRPYYIVSQSLNTPDLITAVSTNGGRTPPLSMRVLGVNYAEAQDPTSKALYNSYQFRLASFYNGALPVGGTENYYDAAYYLLYSIAQSSSLLAEPDGNKISTALQYRILSNAPTDSGNVYIDPYGTPTLGSTISRLFSDSLYSISLWGTMGDPSLFDKPSGMRTCATSAWCVYLKSGSTTAYEIKYDGLIYDPKNKNFTPNSAGVPACLQQYCAMPDGGTGSCPLN